MASNFDFLQQEFAFLAPDARKAEEYVFTDPVYSAILSRKNLEAWVGWLYDNDSELTLPADTSLSVLMHEKSFTEVLPPTLVRNLHLLRRTGNLAAHSNTPVTGQDSLLALRILFDLSQWVVRLYSRSHTPTTAFDEALLPTGDPVKRSRKELEALQAQYEDTRQQLERANKALEQNEAARAALEARLAEMQQTKQRNRNSAPAFSASLSEAETRRLYIDVMLKEAGWDVSEENVCEYPVVGMPGNSGKGKADYVLWGDDHLPLAVVEAKKTTEDVEKGKRQAELYADCLGKMTGRRPVIFYTNGFETMLWDDASGYPPRQVLGVYSKEELERVVNRRGLRGDIKNAPINKAIADRYYQERAIRCVGEQFWNRNRGALLVMATGSGKTRTAAALVEMLSKAGWAKRILFLADRNALVKQAKDAFNQHLPGFPAIDLTKEEDDGSSRVVFSTYPTMMNRIDRIRTAGRRFYGVGHFDVIIIDEAHRSVYQKYRALFHYFDALFIGLTATPKADGDKDTYELFGLEAHMPTDAYELDQAVFDKYLVPPKALPIPLKFPREGVKYDELSEDDKARYEEDFLATYGEGPEDVSSSAVNSWLFNVDTINKVLDLLMERGQKVSGGDRLGKTIVFARNHAHALFVEECFNKRYPQHGGKMLRVIDNKTYDPQGLIDAFGDPANSAFRIAVSVDMLDTGIDIPEVLNLVFFKPVRSKAKFWQMVGRGTRLCPDVFGPDANKAFFYIFDVCENVAFFSADVKEEEVALPISVTEKRFLLRLELAYLLQQKSGKTEGEQILENDLIGGLQKEVSALTEDDFRVKRVLRIVHTYQQPQNWQPVSRIAIADLGQLAPLVGNAEGSEETARRFDLMCYQLLAEMLEGGSRASFYQQKIAAAVAGLLQKLSIPAVAAQEPLIRATQEPEFWQEAGVERVEHLRKVLRGLIPYVEADQKRNLYTNIADELVGTVEETEMIAGYSQLDAYRKRVERFLRENQNHLTIHRIRTAQPITQAELEALSQMLHTIDGEEKNEGALARITGGRSLATFIRSLLGMDINAAKEAFGEFLQTDRFSAAQIHFINTIINALCKNGVIDKRQLFETPFINSNHEGLSGVFAEGEARRVIEILDVLNGSAVQEVA